MKNPKTLDEYIDLVHQAVYEVDELRAIVEDDEERIAPHRQVRDRRGRRRAHGEGAVVDRRSRAH